MHETFPVSEKIKVGVIGLISMLIVSTGPIGALLGLLGMAYCAFRYNDAKKEAVLKAKDENIALENKEKTADHEHEKSMLTAQMQNMQQMSQQQSEYMSRLLPFIAPPSQIQYDPRVTGTVLTTSPRLGASPQGVAISMLPEVRGQISRPSHSTTIEAGRLSSSSSQQFPQ